jgi:hypothetical protein
MHGDLFPRGCLWLIALLILAGLAAIVLFLTNHLSFT